MNHAFGELEADYNVLKKPINLITHCIRLLNYSSQRVGEWKYLRLIKSFAVRVVVGGGGGNCRLMRGPN